MRTLFAAAVLVGTLAGTPALAAERCDPAVQTEREQVFAELAEQDVRVAGVTGVGGLAEFTRRGDEERLACAVALGSRARVAGVTGAGGLSVR